MPFNAKGSARLNPWALSARSYLGRCSGHSHRGGRLPVCSVRRHWMLTVELRSAVTPPRVNTGLEVSSTDKNTFASQQTGTGARIPFSSPPISEGTLHSLQV